jgi:pimeloyl-ACP methyl ester carboxylesterase
MPREASIAVSRVTSRDGTSIAYHRQGNGPAVVLVTGALDDRSENAPLALKLAQSFTVLNYARRGRGDSGDTLPYAVVREIEDIEALIREAGGSAHLFGVSSGGALALECAAAGLPIAKVAVYEVPYFVDDESLRRWREYAEQLGSVLAASRPGEALEFFHRLTGFSDEHIAAARSSPFWPAAQALEHTLAYDAAVLGDGRAPTARLETVRQPTLVATGGGSGGLFEAGADAIAAAVPHAERRTLEGQGHVVEPKTFAPVLERFFGS